MDSVDPFDEWYSHHLDLKEASEYKPGDWNFHTTNHNVGTSELIKNKQIDATHINDWLDKIVSSAPGIDILFLRHKKLGKLDVKYTWTPFESIQFRQIFQCLHLPAQYFHLRSTGGAQSGASIYKTVRNSKGDVIRIDFIIRPSHGSSTSYGSFWGLALTIDMSSMRTAAFIEGFEDNTRKLFLSLLQKQSRGPIHPLTIPEIILHMSMAHLNECIRIPNEETFYNLEREAHLSRYPHPASSAPHDYREPKFGSNGPRLKSNSNHVSPIWDWHPDRFQKATQTANKCSTTLAYLKRRYSFAKKLAIRLLDIQKTMQDYNYSSNVKDLETVMNQGYQERRERLQNRLFLLEGYEHQVECVQKRVDNLVTMLYTIVAQIDSRSNLQIARAVRSDSIPMRTIAYVTLILLPGTFIAAIFGMNFFQFEEERRRIGVSADFWIYWVVTVPVTVGVLVGWNVWVAKEAKEGDITEKEELPQVDHEKQV